ncbi:tetratricopeptide repeat protein [Nostoc sp. FACHB-152]|uniref:tetratricopeptide repeat protein n=1 Tax=unclassified Nostoc TaxID=2593658 RepID=UPI001687ED22|nr:MULTISPECIES: tetratricopeptide repeat protein [unclassified Nostoc]MBD2449150.1 tetratricopeptide repeat protein [Nostoc sp. FACHB-152]MBD2470407.1 tetratricopeptide repeat protein [Nostoc sp. FACHB-145]
MNSHSFLTSGEQQNNSCQSVVADTSNTLGDEADGSGKSALEESYLRSCALKSAKQGDYTKAIALLNELIHHHPQNALDYNNRGLIYFQTGDKQKALGDYNTALQLNPHLAGAYNNRANYYAACGELAAALDDYDQAIDLNPSYVRAWINRGITLRDLEEYEEAIENFEIALLFGQLEAHIWAERGRTYHLWGDWNCAIADYRRALTKVSLLDHSGSFSGCRLRLKIDTWLNDLLFGKY